jgi:tetrapyrrole methylase family protein/MazG family protein
MTLIILGLGPGDPGLLTRRAWKVLQTAPTVYLRTRRHPTVEGLPEGPAYHSFDDLYDGAEDFESVYSAIVEQIAAAAGAGDVVYAVPGDPMVAEGTVSRLIEVCGEKNIPVCIESGVSFIEPALAALGVDALPGLQFVDATDMALAYHPPIDPDYPALVAQLYSGALASDVKLTLMNQYPDEHPVVLIHAAGTDDVRIEHVALYEIDRRSVNHLTSLYVPAVGPETVTVGGAEVPIAVGFIGFQNTIAHLRAPDGCPWDREQTHQSLRKNLIEETYEVIDAIDADDTEHLREELGDLLLQVVLHAQIAVEGGEFAMTDVIRHIDAKLKRRHPHVWGSVDVHDSPDEVSVNWEQIKAEERADQGQEERSALDGIPLALPALAQAHEYDARAVRMGFDWPDESGVLDKLNEEITELKEATTDAEKFHEVGDLLLIVAVWARWLGISPEDALRAANQRFYDRFSYIERRAREQGRVVTDMSLDEMDALWNERKAQQNDGAQ